MGDRGSVARPEHVRRALALGSPVWSRGRLLGSIERASGSTWALGAWLATRGALSAIAIGLCVLEAAAAAAAAMWVARRGGDGAVRIETLASEGVTWTAGLTLSVGAAFRGFRRDREQGILSLALTRGATVGEYVRGRVGGLVLVLTAAVGGATAVAVLAAVSAAVDLRAVVRHGVGAIAYSLAFSATLGPVAMAAFGVRSRAGGYLALLIVVVLPELLSPWTRLLLPQGWHELTSIPAMLEAVRAAALRPAEVAASGARAAAGLAAVVALSMTTLTLSVERAARVVPS